MSVDDDEYANLLDELDDLVERFLAQTTNSDDMVEFLRDAVGNAPAEVAGYLLGAHVIGQWDLTEQELARIWLIGHAMGYSGEELLHDETLAEAVPGRGTRPPTPPGYGPALLGGGGHGPGRGRPGKREFPASWSDDDVIARTMEVAREPSGTFELPSGDFRAHGERHGVAIAVLVSARGDVLSSYPTAGDGVVQNTLDEQRSAEVHHLQELVDALPSETDETRASLDELIAVGEWPHVVRSLRALDPPWTDQQRAQLNRLAELAGLPPDV